jgi:hypothetical protein
MKDRLITIAISVSLSAFVSLCILKPSVSAQSDTLEVERLIVRGELIVSDTGKPWEEGFEKEMVARGIYARGGEMGSAGLWVRGRLIKSEVDDPFDDRYQSVNRDGAMHRAPGHISWNVWLGDAWRQLAIIQGEALEYSEEPAAQWTGGNHPGRLRFQSFRPGHDEPLTDAIIGQGKMSIGGGGFGGGGLPYPSEVLQLWGGEMTHTPVGVPEAPVIVSDDASGAHSYSIVSVGPQGARSAASPVGNAKGLASIRWDNAAGADAYIVLRDGKDVSGPIRIEGSVKEWVDKGQG